MRSYFCQRLFSLFYVGLLLPMPLHGHIGSILTHLNKYKNSYITAATALFCTGSIYSYNHYKNYKQITWPWKTLEASDQYPAKPTDFPPDFEWGVGTSAYQVDGHCTNSTYHTWEKTAPNYTDTAGIACDHWNRYTEDIHHMHELGITTYRFSIEWSTIEPRPGEFNTDAIQHYIDVCKTLMNYNIRPALGFHHYSDPQWFMDTGGFAAEKNIAFFVRFCTVFFTELAQQLPELFTQPRKPLFLTFNSPACYAANGYVTGTRPPGEKNMQHMLVVIKNMLEAHVQVYQSLKSLPYGTEALIGITHNIYQCDPFNWYNPLHHITCYVADKIMHKSIYEFFTSGIFSLRIPCKGSVSHKNRQAPYSLDFVGLNYYGHCFMDTQRTIQPSEEIAVNERYTLYAEGLYRAIKEISDKLTRYRSIPLFITENGIGNTNPTLRDLFFKRYIYALSQAIKDGYAVAGYINWSFMDNYEWGTYNAYYGIYAIDRTPDPHTGIPSLKRTIRNGNAYLINLIQEHRKMKHSTA